MENHLANSSWDADRVFTKAKGSTIWLNDAPCLDFACGPGVSNIGHNHPEVLKAISQVYCNDEAGWGGNMLLNRYQVELAEKLCALTPGSFPKKVFFSNSGGEAVEAAILACLKRRPERPGILSFIGDFHGRLGFGRTATTSKPLHIEGVPWGVHKAFFLIFPAENPETPEKKEFLDKISTAAAYLNYVDNTIGPFLNEINFALFELVQGEGGMNIAQKEMIRGLFWYLREHDIRVIVDEVQSGLGRTGKMWASDSYGVEPDILTVAKALSGGVVPIGATILREDLDYRKSGEHCNTFGANPPACAAGLKVLEIIREEKLCDASWSAGFFFRETLQAGLIARPEVDEAVTDVSGLGLMSRITFRNAAFRDAVVAQALNRGVYLMGCGRQSVRLMPPLTITNEEIVRGAAIILDAIADVQTK